MAFTGLMNEFTETCVLLEKTRVPDGEGGWATTWYDGMVFTAAITHDSTMTARVAEKEGMRATYTITTEKGYPLEFHDVLRRESDGKTFRVTSDGVEKMTPNRANFQISQVSAEEWELT